MPRARRLCDCGRPRPGWRKRCFTCRPKNRAVGLAISAGHARRRRVVEAATVAPDRPRLVWYRLVCLACARHADAARMGDRLIQVVREPGGPTRLRPIGVWPPAALRCQVCGGNVFAEPATVEDRAGEPTVLRPGKAA